MPDNRSYETQRIGDRFVPRLSGSGTFHIDLPLFTALCILAGVGLVILYSASGQDSDIIFRQLIRLGIGFGVMFLTAQIPPHHIKYWAPWIFGIGLCFLTAVLVVGEIGKGAQRWLDLGLFRFQPSEVMKIAVPIMAAWYLSDRTLPPAYKHLAVAGILILLPALLIAKQPDLGTSL